METKSNDLTQFLANVACVSVLAKNQKRWRPNFDLINATGADLGVADSDIMPGGKYEADIHKGMSVIGDLARLAGKDNKRAARRSAESLYGPRGELAAGFMTR